MNRRTFLQNYQLIPIPILLSRLAPPPASAGDVLPPPLHATRPTRPCSCLVHPLYDRDQGSGLISRFTLSGSNRRRSFTRHCCATAKPCHTATTPCPSIGLAAPCENLELLYPPEETTARTVKWAIVISVFPQRFHRRSTSTSAKNTSCSVSHFASFFFVNMQNFLVHRFNQSFALSVEGPGRRPSFPPTLILEHRDLTDDNQLSVLSDDYHLDADEPSIQVNLPKQEPHHFVNHIEPAPPPKHRRPSLLAASRIPVCNPPPQPHLRAPWVALPLLGSFPAHPRLPQRERRRLR